MAKPPPAAPEASTIPDPPAHLPDSTGREDEGLPSDAKVSDQLERWLRGDQPKTLSSLMDVFGERSFAIVFVLLMALPALPLPTGGATHVLEVVTMLLALELVLGRSEIWLPRRWKQLPITGGSREKLINALLKRIRWLERYSRPRGQAIVRRRLVRSLLGFAVLAFALTAFLAPPFSGLDTLPSVGVVVLGLGILLTDIVLVAAGLLVGALGIVTVVGLGALVTKAVGQLL
jgi:hypothetical protein